MPVLRAGWPSLQYFQLNRSGLGGGFLMRGNGGGHGINALQDAPGDVGIGNFEAVGFVQGHDELKGVHGIKADAAGAEEWLVVGNFLGPDLKHEVLDHEPLDFLFEYDVIH